MILARSFFEQKTLKVAQDLLGCFLIRQIGQKKISGRIVETEAYCGSKDLANHASKGRTNRTEAMFGPPGHAYVYLIYGMHYCFNIVTEKSGYPAAVLIRGVELDDRQTIIGPGKVCRALKIDKSLHGVDLVKSQKIWVEDNNQRLKDWKIVKLPRVSIDYAGEYKYKRWRFRINPNQ